MRILSIGLAAVVALGLLAGGRADGAFTITFSQVGTDVVASGAGSLNITGLSAFLTNSPQLNGFAATAIVGDPTQNGINYAAFVTNQTPFGTRDLGLVPTSGSGGPAGIFGANTSNPLSVGPFVVTPTAYASGATISSSSKFANQTFASLGLTAGTYTYAYSATQGGPTLDTVTVQVGPAVPEPASAALLAAGLAGVGLAWRRAARRRPVA